MNIQALIILATEGGIPASNPWAKAAVPIGIVLFVGSIYMLLRANLGTRRGYLVMSVALWGFLMIHSLFWAFGAPGTPPVTGPQNLPGQSLAEYEPTWVPLASDSTLADDPNYSAVKTYPEGFGDVPESFAAEANSGIGDIGNFFTREEVATIPLSFEPVMDSLRYAEAGNGRGMIAVTYQATFVEGEPAPEGEAAPPEGEAPAPEGEAAAEDDGALAESIAGPGDEVGAIDPEGDQVTLFAFFDGGARRFPSFLIFGIVSVLFGLHAVLLGRDEDRERRERKELEEVKRESVGASA